MKKPIYVLTIITIVALIATIAWTMNQQPTTLANTGETATIVDMFKQGLKTNQANSPNLHDADMFGAALVSIAWERLEKNPDAAPQMFTAFEQYVADKTPRERYSLWDVFLENLEAALLKSRNAEHLKTNWVIRQKATEKQTVALKEWAATTGKQLGDYAQTASKSATLAELEPLAPDVQEAVEFLLDEADTAEFDMTELQNKAANIARIIDDKLADVVTKFEQEVETERQRDLGPPIVGPDLDKTATKDNDKVWKIGKYQELLDEVLPIVNLRESPAVTFWTSYRKDENGDMTFLDRLAKTHQEARHLQRIRYNLWAVQVLSKDSSISEISHIDPGFLEPSVSASYSQREATAMSQQANERGRDAREILLRSKVPLSAF